MPALKAPLPWRIFRSPLADYCDELADLARAYSPEVLGRIREDGYNAVWLRVVLRECVATSVFPDLQPREGALDRLREIAECCARAGLKVFVYLNEPLGFPEDALFWEVHPELRGHLDRSFDDGWDRANALCTSQEKTRLFLEEASSALFQEVPKLAGVILITASEHLTHCFSHESRYLKVVRTLAPADPYPLQCSLCAQRTPAEIVGEIVMAIDRGVRAARKDATVIAWNWSWSYFEESPQQALIAALPERVAVMVDFERGGRQELSLTQGDVSIQVDEYSLGYVGPSPLFSGVADIARQKGHEVLAKLQIGTTHEIATVPNLPLIPHLVRKIFHLREIGAAGFTATWCLGTFPSLNTFAVGWLCSRLHIIDEPSALRGIAGDYFPDCDAADIVEAWETFCRAFAHFPQIQDFLYRGPVNAAPAYPWALKEGPLRPTWFPPQPYGDQFETCLGPLSLDEIIETLQRLLNTWRQGLKIYAKALGTSNALPAKLELGVAQAIGHQMESATNLLAFHRAVRTSDEPEMHRLRLREIAQLRDFRALVKSDSRLGFHQGCFPRPQFFYDLPSIEQKLRELAEGGMERP